MTKSQMMTYIEETILQLDSIDSVDMYYQKKDRLINKLKSIEYIDFWQRSVATDIRQWNEIFDTSGKILKYNLEMRTRSKNKIYYKGAFGKKMIGDAIFIFSLHIRMHSLLADTAPEDAEAPVIKMNR